jgi:hypothetical protein
MNRSLLLAMAVVMTLAGCAGETASGGSGIDGLVVSGPHCPVERVDSPCPDLPVAEATVVASDQAGDEAGRATSGSDGRFRLSLEPGPYTLTVEGLKGIQFAKPVAVQVPSGRYVGATLLVDTGIR